MVSARFCKRKTLTGQISGATAKVHYQANEEQPENFVYVKDGDKVLPEVIKIAPFNADKHGHSKSGKNYHVNSKIVPLLIQALKKQKHQSYLGRR